MAAAPVKDRPRSAVDVIRDQHWLELSDYLGLKPASIKATMKLWFTILAELGYDLVATGTNRQVARPQPPATVVAEVAYTDMYHAIEEALIDVASRRSQGERISDQAEVREITTKALACIKATASGNSGDDRSPREH